MRPELQFLATATTTIAIFQGSALASVSDDLVFCSKLSTARAPKNLRRASLASASPIDGLVSPTFTLKAQRLARYRRKHPKKRRVKRIWVR